MKHLLLCLGLIIAIQNAFCQKVSDELKKINGAYEKLLKVQVDVTYNVYQNHLSTVPVEVTKGVIKKENTNIYSSVGDVTTISNSKYYFSVDEGSNTLVVSNIRAERKQSSAFFTDLDTLLSYCRSSVIKPYDASTNRIILSLNEDLGEIEKIEFFYNKNSYLLNKIILFYGYEISIDDEGLKPEQKPRMEIEYHKYDTAPKFSALIFSEKDFFYVEKGALRPADKFKNFTILDQRIKKK